MSNDGSEYQSCQAHNTRDCIRCQPKKEEPAFPQTEITFETGKKCGLTKREWFAGMAMQGLLKDNPNRGTVEFYAEESFNFADAMIEASKK